MLNVVYCLIIAYSATPAEIHSNFERKRDRESEIEINKLEKSKSATFAIRIQKNSDSIDSGIGRAAVARTVQKSVRARKY